MKGSELYARLLNMRNESGKLLYQRLRMCKELLGDREWVAAADGGGGDEAVAMDRLESECFADICGSMTLTQLLQVIDAVPTETVWKANKYNLRKMWNEVIQRRKVSKGPKSKQAPMEHKTREQRKIEHLEAEVQFARDRIKELEGENRRLKVIVDRIAKTQELIQGLNNKVA